MVSGIEAFVAHETNDDHLGLNDLAVPHGVQAAVSHFAITQVM
jgi:hypothetical protein